MCILRVHRGRRRTTAVLIIEVADTTLSFDRDVKLSSYARYGVHETWLVHMEALMVTRYSNPRGEDYEQAATLTGHLAPLASPSRGQLRGLPA